MTHVKGVAEQEDAFFIHLGAVLGGWVGGWVEGEKVVWMSYCASCLDSEWVR